MKAIKVHLIAAARPNVMKVAPLYHALKEETWCHPILVHTGQHYDANMSDDFFRDLGLPEPDHYLGVGSGSHAEQTGKVMMAYENLCLDEPPDWTVVVGDVNSTMACALAAKKLCLPVAHLEAGLRSRDRTMPEEINRIVTDAISDLLWTPSPDADENLLQEGVDPEAVIRVGNIMIDSYEMMRGRIEKEEARKKFNLSAQGYGVVTLHRPTNVDDKAVLKALIGRLTQVAKRLPLVFPVHPRVAKRLRQFELWKEGEAAPGLRLLDPMSYVPFMSLVSEAKLVITDSGGIQEETTYLNIPCLTMRDTTERPITISQGTNQLVRQENLVSTVERVLDGGWSSGRCPELWDGHTAERVVANLRDKLG